MFIHFAAQEIQLKYYLLKMPVQKDKGIQVFTFYDIYGSFETIGIVIPYRYSCITVYYL